MDKEQINNFKKFIKDENPGAQRLNSLRLPRDLTLGGTILRHPKKQFVPNLTVSRNKEKAKEIVKRNGVSSNLKDNKFNKKGPNFDGKRNSARFMQSSGIFSDGIGDDSRRSNRWSNKRNDKENDGNSSCISMPTLKKKNWVVDKKVENNVLDDLRCQDDIDEIDEKLPFQPLDWLIETPAVKKEVKREDNIQTSSSALAGIQPVLNNLKLETNQCVSSEYFDDTYDDINPVLSLWKMPDSLCGKGLSDDPMCKQLFDYYLNDMLEGQIGKLVIRKSGKIDVQIGRIMYQLEQHNFESCTEDVVTLDPNSEKGAAASVLGGIKHKYTLTPDWDSLLQ